VTSEVTTLAPRPSAGDSALDWLRRNPAVVCLMVAVAVSGALLIALGSRLILYGDEWNVVLGRTATSAGAFLDPYNGHLVVGLVAIYKLLLAGFGMSSPLPFHVASTLIYLTAAVLLFAYARRRVGDWLALLGTTVILFFGAAAVDLLSPFQMFFSGSIAAGLGAFLALDRGDRRGDALACALLVVAISFSEVGVAFSIGVLVRLALARQPLAPRLYVAFVPLILYAIWWLGWGHTASSDVSFHTVATTPVYVLDAASTGVGALLGITSSGDQRPAPVGQDWAPILLVAAVGLALWRVRRMGSVPAGVWPVLAAALVFWTLAGINESDLRPPNSGRYLYPSGVFILLIGTELLQGIRLGARTIFTAVVVAAIALAANLVFLSDSYRLFWKPGGEVSRANLRALEIAGPLNSAYELPLGFVDINTASYLSAVDAWGSPAYTESELASASESSRAEADKALGEILGLRLQPGGSAGAPCATVRASASGATVIELSPGRVTLRASPSTEAKVRLGRFSDQLPFEAGTLKPGSRASLAIPADRSARLWRLGLRGGGPVEACGSSLRSGPS
jgi:hypothetical protein